MATGPMPGFTLRPNIVNGLSGSRYDVDQPSGAELKRILEVFNAEMLATNESDFYHLYAMTGDGLPNLVTDAAIAAGSRVKISGFLAGEVGRSDDVSFHEVAVPAALFIRVHPHQHDPFADYFESLYHTPQAMLVENVSEERMQERLDIVSGAVFEVIRKEAPALENSRVRADP